VLHFNHHDSNTSEYHGDRRNKYLQIQVFDFQKDFPFFKKMKTKKDRLHPCANRFPTSSSI